jgi:hypothetical protein
VKVLEKQVNEAVILENEKNHERERRNEIIEKKIIKNEKMVMIKNEEKNETVMKKSDEKYEIGLEI